MIELEFNILSEFAEQIDNDMERIWVNFDKMLYKENCSGRIWSNFRANLVEQS